MNKLYLLAIPFLLFQVDALSQYTDKSTLEHSTMRKRDPNLEAKINALIKSKDSDAFHRAYKHLFSDADPILIQKLKLCRNKGIALSAAWEEAIFQAKKTSASSSKATDTSDLNRFLGFVEGRLSIRLPNWWQNAVLTSTFSGGHTFFLPGKNSLYHETALGFQAPKDTTVEKGAGKYILKVGNEQMLLPPVIVGRNTEDDSIPAISAAFSTANCFLALHQDTVYPFPLFCFDRKTGSLKWTKQVWGQGGQFLTQGPNHHWVTVLADCRDIFVFGGTATSIYIEVFNQADGERLYHFCTVFSSTSF